jgi:two-component system nitrogen regulation response regulator GlnG/two-component system response regulator HydG
MADQATATEHSLPWERPAKPGTARVLHLVLAWSLEEPERVGEAVRVDQAICLGRGAALPDDPSPRAELLRMRPGSTERRGPITCSRISRLQLVLSPSNARPDAIELRSVGRAAVRVNGRECTTAEVTAGDVVEIHNGAVFVVGSRPLSLPAAADAIASFPFGAPDPFGIVGESESAWRLRSELAFAASTDRHVLLLGESGSGKELAARTVHGRSPRHDKPMVARNAATMPTTLLDAELFGNVKNYPNPGMPERPGLVGEADGSTLFLDEIGDLPEAHQVHLLRVLDADGEYQRLGEAKPRRSSFRLVAATNRPLEALKHDFLARFTHRLAIPNLAERREDVPLLISTLLSRMAQKTPAVAARFFEQRGGKKAEPRLAPNLIVRLLRHPFTHHVRELDRLLWLAVASAEGEFIGLTPAVEKELGDAEEAATVTPADLDRDVLVKALADNGRSPSKAAKALGLKNRYVLLRLMKKHGVSAGVDDDASEA